MLIRDIKDAEYFRSGDNCILCELLHPKNSENYGGAKLFMNYSLAHAIVPGGEKTIPHRLFKSSEVYYILSGEARMHIGDESEDLSAGQAVYIPPGCVQYIENTGDSDLIFLAVASPEWNESDEEILI
ncbi:MAG: cupin domain-containing protein [Methanomicrobiaceae archaeon]|nr:cupin domain-containing protein [Methanomicrobiaceae archaeon]